ncbi:hypothetical protein GJ496_007055 [Pomphorhynchus laevis]|nr:hypothetical protein GJ496_007055 [Pomphorhynchus laevis]
MNEIKCNGQLADLHMANQAINQHSNRKTLNVSKRRYAAFFVLIYAIPQNHSNCSANIKLLKVQNISVVATIQQEYNEYIYINIY